ncbi:MAG: c-type cytochrome [Planctomycetes bacterium]|nr:c-type cytochrome [Planctomycetota bacterium]
MPVSTDHLYGKYRTNLVFAISAAILALSTIWLIKVDHERPWKEYQSGYMESQAVLAELQYLVTQQESFQDQLTQARTRFEEERQTIDRAQNPEYDRLLTLLEDKKAEQYNIDLEFKQKDAWIIVTRSELEQATAIEGTESEPARQLAAKLKQDEEALAATRLRNEQVDDKIRELTRARKKQETGFITARRALDELTKQVDTARNKRDRYSSVLGRAIFNAHLGDFVAPKGTPGRYEVKQVVAMGVKSKLNFLEGYKVDRCTTCHVVIDDENFSQQNLAAQFERAIPALNEALARSGGSSNAPTITMPEPPVIYGLRPDQLKGRVAEYWEQVSREDREAYFAQLQAGVNAYLDHEGLPTIDLEQPLQAHPDLNLFLSTGSPHPINQMGCTVCHEGNGMETDFMFAAHTPKSHHEKEEWAEKYYDRNLGVPTMTWSTLEHFWDFPMIPPQYSEASCAKCHDALDDISRFQGRDYGEKIRTGKKLYTQLGCINCHRVENIDGLRQVGTDLTHVSSKLSDGFMHNWIFSPRDFRPATWMPHFFMQENNGPGSANKWDPAPELRTRTEVQAITHYLQTVSEPWVAEAAPAGLSGDPAAGQQLFADVGCLACHGNIAEYGEAWIVNDLVERQLSEDPDADEDEAFEQAEAQFGAMNLNAQVKYAVRHFTEERRADAEHRAAREELLATADRRDPDPRMLYIPPMYTRFGPDLSGVGSKVSEEWLYGWLQEPRHYSGTTKMPRLRLSEQEAVDLAAYLLTLKHDTFDTAPFEVSEATVASLDRSMEDFLSGQNSAATVEKYKSDADGLLTRTLVVTLSKHAERAVQDARTQHYEQALAGMDLTAKKMLFVGQKTITHYGCYACHNIAGFEATPRPGTELTDWGEKSIHQLDFAFFGGAYHHTLAETEEFQELYPKERTDLIEWSHSGNIEIDSVHTHSSFATLKLLNPRVWDRLKIKRPYAKLKMPNYYLAQHEVDALVTYLLSRRPARVADALKIQYDRDLSGPIAEGRFLVRDLNCIGCHRIEDNVATIHQFISAESEDDEDDWDEEEEDEEEGEDDADSALARLGDGYGGAFDVPNGPPWLRGQGAKVQPEWFHSFLLNVEALRPWLKVRMPSFNLTGEQASILVDYFAALSKDEANDLKDDLKRIHKYVAQSGDPESARDDWHRNGATASLAGLLRDYSVENELLKPNKFDFRKKDEAAIDEVYRDVLGNAEFFAHLYDIQYPFAYNDFTPMDVERYALGERLFGEMACLACHVLGDSAVPGSNPAPTAPNLALTHKRIRYEWFRQWMQEPRKMQPETNMPQWFPGGQSGFSEVMGYKDEMREALAGPGEPR